jgi:hypothetical protein
MVASCEKKKAVLAALLGLYYLLATDATASVSAQVAPPRQLTPTPVAHELFHHAHNTWWGLDLQAASQEVVDLHRRRKRGKIRQQHRQTQSSNNCLSPLQRWFVSLIETIGMDKWEELNYYNITSLAYLYKHYVSSSSGLDEYFGVNGENTKHMKANHESLKQFWTLGINNGISVDVNSTNLRGPSNVVLLGMHGNDLSAKGKLVPTLQQLYSLDGPTALALADKIQSIIQTLPDAYNNPVLTANALAIQSQYSDGSNSERDSIIVGDGVFAFLEWLKLDYGPDYIHSHEFGHHVQYDLGIMQMNGMGLDNAEETRRLELMSDMFGSYYLAHKSGGGLDTNELDEVHRAAFSMGDCESSIATHHGSPRQRECASNYGANLAVTFGGSVLPPVKLKNMFDFRLSEILAVSAAECREGLDESVLDNTFYENDSGDSAVVESLDASLASSSSKGGGNWWDSKLPVEDVKDLNIPILGVPPPSADVQYASWGYSSESGSGHKPWGSDNGWEFEWYVPEEKGNIVSKSPESRDNYSWFGTTSQWIASARTVNSGSTKRIDVSFGLVQFCLLGLMF